MICRAGCLRWHVSRRVRGIYEASPGRESAPRARRTTTSSRSAAQNGAVRPIDIDVCSVPLRAGESNRLNQRPPIEDLSRRMPDHSVAVPHELEQLLECAQSGVLDDAWSALISKHSRLLLTVARSVAAEHDGMMDAYAYVLERMREDDYRRLRGYVSDGRSTFTTWLVVVARRMCVDQYRRRYGRAPRGEGDVSPAREDRASRRRLFDLSATVSDLNSIADDQTPDPETAVRVAQRDASLSGALENLDPADRLLLKLRFEDDLSAREIATVMQMPSAFHVYRRLASVCASLRRGLVARGVVSSAP